MTNYLIFFILLIAVNAQAFDIKKAAVENGRRFNVEPAFILAVAHVESRQGQQEFRYGMIGRKYYGPMGIHQDFLKRWDIADPAVNVMVGARALQGIGSDHAKQRARLRRYNSSCNQDYIKAVMAAKKKYQ